MCMGVWDELFHMAFRSWEKHVSQKWNILSKKRRKTKIEKGNNKNPEVKKIIKNKFS